MFLLKYEFGNCPDWPTIRYLLAQSQLGIRQPSGLSEVWAVLSFNCGGFSAGQFHGVGGAYVHTNATADAAVGVTHR